MEYSVKDLANIVNANSTKLSDENAVISTISYDTRKISAPQNSVFIALKGLRDGHQFLEDAYNKGIRNFIVSENHSLNESCNVLFVDDTLAALQAVAEWHRSKHPIQTIAITGSNGKTIIKEWLSLILASEYRIVKSPKSFNSQIGVPLSIIQYNNTHELAVIEAGISESGEMAHLEKIIKPDIGILSNIGDAHSAGFKSLKEKLLEKLLLFKDASVIIYNRADLFIHQQITDRYPDKMLFSWGASDESQVKILDQYIAGPNTHIKLLHKSEIFTFVIPFVNDASIENIMHAICACIFLGMNYKTINANLAKLESIPLRFEIEKGRNNCTLINDSYSIDLASLKIALEFLNGQIGNNNKAIIISDFEQQNDHEHILLAASNLINEKQINTLITVGGWIEQIKSKLKPEINHLHFLSTTDLIEHIGQLGFDHSDVLIKGARSFHLERVFKKLAQQVHQTSLEINLSHIVYNINAYKSKLKPTTKIMAVIKASAYGSGAAELAQYISDKGIDYLAVALADEGVELRKAGIENPILVFNLQNYGLDLLWEYNLEPEVYSLNQLKTINDEAIRRKSEKNIHLKLDTGMRRLGLVENDLTAAIEIITKSPYLRLASIFSHLASSEDVKNDEDSRAQFLTFENMSGEIMAKLDYQPLRHILNSAGVLRFTDHQYDMIRLGLGMYGINEAHGESIDLRRAHTLKTKILQIKALAKGEATGYGRHEIADKDMTIAIIGIGYADGLMRNSGNGHYSVLVKNQMAPIIGNVCMDVSIIDITGLGEIKEGDEVQIFGESQKIEKLAQANNTISYEIISRISKRVKRIYIEE